MKTLQRLVLVALLGTMGVMGSCVSVGEGSGDVISGELYARDCWDMPFDLKPDFFAADPFRNAMHIRVQRGEDLLEFSDGVVILVDDVELVRQHLGEPLEVTLPVGVAPPGVPVGTACGETACTSNVHVALYLLDSCHSQNVVLYATSGTVTFNEIFNNDPNEKEASEKLTDAEFAVTIGDPRDIILEGEDAGTIPNQSELTGNFRFYFQRGQPAQPFP